MSEERVIDLASEKLARKQLRQIDDLRSFDQLLERLFFDISVKELIPCGYYQGTQELFPDQYFEKTYQPFISQLLLDVSKGDIKLTKTN